MSFHPAYGYTEGFREEVLQFASRHGINAAAEAFNVHETSIRRWRRQFPVSGVPKFPSAESRQ